LLVFVKEPIFGVTGFSLVFLFYGISKTPTSTAQVSKTVTFQRLFLIGRGKDWDLNSLNRPIRSDEIEVIRMILPTKNSPSPVGLLAKFY
jgi:hypothetical protein